MSMIYYCKGVSLMKLKTMCKLYVSLLLPCPRVSSLYFCCQISPPWNCSSFYFSFSGLSVWRSSSSFSLYICLEFIGLTSMLKRVFGNMAWAHLTVTQHVLIKTIFGDIKKKKMYSACRRRSPSSPWIEF